MCCHSGGPSGVHIHVLVSHDSQLSSAYRNSRMQWAQRAVGSMSASQKARLQSPELPREDGHLAGAGDVPR